MGGMNLGIIGGIHFNVGSQTDKSPSSCQPFHSRLGNPIPIFCHQSSGSCFLPSSASAGHNLTSTLNTINIFSLHLTISHYLVQVAVAFAEEPHLVPLDLHHDPEPLPVQQRQRLLPGHLGLPAPGLEQLPVIADGETLGAWIQTKLDIHVMKPLPYRPGAVLFVKQVQNQEEEQKE